MVGLAAVGIEVAGLAATGLEVGAEVELIELAQSPSEALEMIGAGVGAEVELVELVPSPSEALRVVGAGAGLIGRRHWEWLGQQWVQGSNWSN